MSDGSVEEKVQKRHLVCMSLMLASIYVVRRSSKTTWRRCRKCDEKKGDADEAKMCVDSPLGTRQTKKGGARRCSRSLTF